MASATLKLYKSLRRKTVSFLPLLQRFENSQNSNFYGRAFGTGYCCQSSKTNASDGNADTSRPLLEFVQQFESISSKEQEKIPRTWTKAGRRGGIYSYLQNSRPQILGFNVEQVQERIEMLGSLGITDKDALAIAVELPSHLEFNGQNFKATGGLLVRLGCNLPRLIMKAPYIFGVDIKTLEANVQRLEAVGITSEVIGKAIDANPMIIIYPVTDNALEIMNLLLSSCEFRESLDDCSGSDFRQVSQQDFALHLLLQPFDGAKEQVLLGDNFKQVANFLREIQVSSCLVVLNNPAFFAADVDKLYQAMEFFTGRPLLFEMELIQKMLITKSEVFLNFDRDVFQERVELLKRILKTPRQLYLLLQKYFFFQWGQIELEDNIKILEKYKFQNEQIANILITKDFFVSGETDLEKKLEFLLSIEGIDVNIVAENSFCLLKALNFLENRVKFAREVKKGIPQDVTMEMLFQSEDDEFVTVICESSVEKYEEVTGEMISQKKSKSSQQRRKRKTTY